MPVRPLAWIHAHFDLLHQFLAERINSIQTMHLVVDRLVGCGIAQDKGRIELGQGVLGCRAFHLLRLIRDQDRSILRNHIDGVSIGIQKNGVAQLEIIQFLVDPPVVRTARIETPAH